MIRSKKCITKWAKLHFFWLLLFFCLHSGISEAATNNELSQIRCSLSPLENEKLRIRIAFDFTEEYLKLKLFNPTGEERIEKNDFDLRYEIAPETDTIKQLFESTEIHYGNSGGKIYIETGFKSLRLFLSQDYQAETDGVHYLGNGKTAYMDLILESSSNRPNQDYSKIQSVKHPNQLSEILNRSSDAAKGNASMHAQNDLDNNAINSRLRNFLNLSVQEYENLTEGQYILSPRDILKIKIYFDVSNRDNVAELENIPVKLDGAVYIPVLGNINANGTTTELLALYITEKLKEDYIKPFATVEVTEYLGNTVTIIGDTIRRKLPFFKDDRLFDLFKRNFLLLSKSQYLSNIVIKHSNGELNTYNLNEFLEYNDLKQNPKLYRDDIIYLNPEAQLEVVVLGAVRSPGTHTLPKYISLFDAIAQSGGFSENAKISKIRIIRRNQIENEIFNLDRYIKGKEDLRQIQLEEGDIVYVYEKRRLINWWILRDVILTISAGISLYYLIS